MIQFNYASPFDLKCINILATIKSGISIGSEFLAGSVAAVADFEQQYFLITVTTVAFFIPLSASLIYVDENDTVSEQLSFQNLSFQLCKRTALFAKYQPNTGSMMNQFAVKSTNF